MTADMLLYSDDKVLRIGDAGHMHAYVPELQTLLCVLE